MPQAIEEWLHSNGGIVVILYWIAMPLLVRVARRRLYSEKKAQ
jgi:hypothetical protein